jgi:hypothetical protein
MAPFDPEVEALNLIETGIRLLDVPMPDRPSWVKNLALELLHGSDDFFIQMACQHPGIRPLAEALGTNFSHVQRRWKRIARLWPGELPPATAKHPRSKGCRWVRQGDTWFIQDAEGQAHEVTP